MKTFRDICFVVGVVAILVYVMKKAAPSMPDVEEPDYTDNRYKNSSALDPSDRGANVDDNLLGQERDALT